MGSMTSSLSPSIAPTDTATSVASVATATPENTNVHVVGGESVILPSDHDNNRSLYCSHGKWAWANGLEILGTDQGSQFSYGKEGSADLKVGRIKDKEIVYISQLFSIWDRCDCISSYLFLNASDKYLRPLQGDCVPWIIGAFHRVGGQVGIVQDLPHPKGWREADMFLEENEQAAVIAAYQKLHDRGVLHGRAEYCHWLIGDDKKVTIIDFRSSRLVKREEDAKKANVGDCSAQDIADEMRKVKFMLNYRDSREKEFELARLQHAREKKARSKLDSMTHEENASDVPTALPDLDQLSSAGEQWAAHHFQVIGVGDSTDIRKTAAPRLPIIRKPVAALSPFSPEAELTPDVAAAEISELQHRRVHRIMLQNVDRSPSTVSWIGGNRVPSSDTVVSLKRPLEEEPADEFSDEDDDLDDDDLVPTDVSSDSDEDMEVGNKNGADKGKGKGRKIQMPVKKRQRLDEAPASSVPKSKRRQQTGNGHARTTSYYGEEFFSPPPSASGPTPSSANGPTPSSAIHPTLSSANRPTPSSVNHPPSSANRPTPPPASRPSSSSANRPIPSSANRHIPSSASHPIPPKKPGNIINVHSTKKNPKLLAAEAVRSWHLFQVAREELERMHRYIFDKQNETERYRDDFLRTILNVPAEERKFILDSVGQPDSFAVVDLLPNQTRESPARVEALKHLQDQRQRIVNTVVQARPSGRVRKELPRVVDIKRAARADEAIKRAARGNEAMRMPSNLSKTAVGPTGLTKPPGPQTGLAATPIPQPVVSNPSPQLQAVLDRMETYKRVVIRRVCENNPDLEHDPEDSKDRKALEENSPPPTSGALDELLVRKWEEEDQRLLAKRLLDPKRSHRPSTPGTPSGPGLNLGEEPDVDLSDMEDYEPDPIDEAAKQAVYDEAAAIEAGTLTYPPEPPALDPSAKPRCTHGRSAVASTSSAAKRKRGSEDGAESIGPNPKKSKVW